MGCCESCFPTKKYEPIVDKGRPPRDSSESFTRTTEEVEEDFDMNSSVFAGCEMMQKFTNKSSYDRRFVWLNIKSRTVHMSQYMTKERRHKEASLNDVTSVIYGPPLKSKIPINDKQCLTVHFRRGGGIDLLLPSEAECLLWFQTMNKICQSSEFFGRE